MPTSLNERRGKERSWVGDLLTQRPPVGWVGDAVRVAVEVAMVVSTYLA